MLDVVPDWSAHCVLHYEDQGLWGALSALVSCSPWVLSVFLLSLYHICWSAVTLLLQLYQVTDWMLTGFFFSELCVVLCTTQILENLGGFFKFE